MTELQNISNCNYIIFCLPTPLKKNAPDMSYVISAFNKIYKYLNKNQNNSFRKQRISRCYKRNFSKCTK